MEAVLAGNLPLLEGNGSPDGPSLRADMAAPVPLLIGLVSPLEAAAGK